MDGPASSPAHIHTRIWKLPEAIPETPKGDESRRKVGGREMKYPTEVCDKGSGIVKDAVSLPRVLRPASLIEMILDKSH